MRPEPARAVEIESRDEAEMQEEQGLGDWKGKDGAWGLALWLVGCLSLPLYGEPWRSRLLGDSELGSHGESMRDLGTVVGHEYSTLSLKSGDRDLGVTNVER